MKLIRLHIFEDSVKIIAKYSDFQQNSGDKSAYKTD